MTPPAPLIGEPLVGRCAEGDDQAWRDLHATYASTVRNFLRRMGVQEQALEDVCQDVFLEAFRYLPGFRGESSLKTWLYRLCLTQARRNLQKRRLKETVLSLLSLYKPVEADFSPLDGHTAARRVEQALDTMNEGERAVFVLYELEGVPGREIALALECPETSVWRRLHYARKKFETSINNQERTP